MSFDLKNNTIQHLDWKEYHKKASNCKKCVSLHPVLSHEIWFLSKQVLCHESAALQYFKKFLEAALIKSSDKKTWIYDLKTKRTVSKAIRDALFSRIPKGQGRQRRSPAGKFSFLSTVLWCRWFVEICWNDFYIQNSRK